MPANHKAVWETHMITTRREHGLRIASILSLLLGKATSFRLGASTVFIGLSLLMEESEARVEMTVTAQSPIDILVAQRILGNPAEFARWEVHHDHLMRPISSRSRLTEQMVGLRATAVTLVHRKALFEYLRQRQLTGVKRRRLLAIFHRCSGHTKALLAEHGDYVRCSSSYLCTQHLAEHLMHDPALDEPLALYEELYSEYFGAFCDVEIAETEQEKQACLAQECLKPFLKYRVNEARTAILAMPARDGRNSPGQATAGDRCRSEMGVSTLLRLNTDRSCVGQSCDNSRSKAILRLPPLCAETSHRFRRNLRATALEARTDSVYLPFVQGLTGLTRGPSPELAMRNLPELSS